MFRRLRDPFSSLSHLLGVGLSIAGLVWLVHLSVKKGTLWHILAFSIFSISLILLYSASTVYHAVQGSQTIIRVLRKIDHCMIYILIAGTYTPVCLVALRGVWGWGIFASIWGLAIAGIVLKIVWLEAPRWLSVATYVLMGWLAVVATVPLVKALTAGGLVWLLIGGILYTAGAAIYGLKWPNLGSKVFGFHELFHLFVLGGSAVHYFVMVKYVLPLP